MLGKRSRNQFPHLPLKKRLKMFEKQGKCLRLRGKMKEPEDFTLDLAKS